MKRPERGSDGKYEVHGHKYNELFGSRKQVWFGSAYKTSGGLTKDDLFYNKSSRRIVSLKKHTTAKKEKRLLKYGYGTRKGKFGYIRIKSKSRKNKKGGKMVGESVEPVEPAEPVEEETPVAPAPTPMDTASSTPREEEISEPVKSEPVKSEPVKSEPVKSEPVKSEPVKSEPVKNAVGGKKSRKSHR